MLLWLGKHVRLWINRHYVCNTSKKRLLPAHSLPAQVTWYKASRLNQLFKGDPCVDPHSMQHVDLVIKRSFKAGQWSDSIWSLPFHVCECVGSEQVCIWESNSPHPQCWHCHWLLWHMDNLFDDIRGDMFRNTSSIIMQFGKLLKVKPTS